MTPAYIIDFQSIGMRDVHRVGGKNASLGEMISHLGEAGVRVPGGFATTAEAYRDFLGQDDLEGRIRKRLAGLDVDSPSPPAAGPGNTSGFAARARQTTPTLPAGCSMRASRASPSNPIPWWRLGCTSRAKRDREMIDGLRCAIVVDDYPSFHKGP